MDTMRFPLFQTFHPIELCDREEAQYRRQIKEAASEARKKEALFLFLAGPSCSGKTTTAAGLKEELEQAGLRVFCFSTDDFFFDSQKAPKNEDGSPNYDAFSHTDSDFICDVLKKLSQGSDAAIPSFDFVSGMRNKDFFLIKRCQWDAFILEGIHALNPKILNALPARIPKLTLYLSTTRGVSYPGFENLALDPVEIRFCRRVIRDYKHRFASAERSFSLWKNVTRMEKEILHPFIPLADLTLSTDFCYEAAVVKEEATGLFRQVPTASPYREEAERMIQKLSPFPALSEALVPKDSVLREFID